jgi:carboxyl-terminal processing protease
VRKWSLLPAILLTSAATLAADRATIASTKFLSLTPTERNLAVYDAFWDTVLTHYYDPSLLATPKLRELRATWRDRAANDPLPAHLYGVVFSGITAQLPESHVAAEFPAVRDMDTIAPRDQGAGFTWTEVRRAGLKYSLVSEVTPGSPAAEAGIRPGWRVVSSGSLAGAEGGDLQFTGEFIPLDAHAAQDWERGALKPADGDDTKIVRIAFNHREVLPKPRFETRRLAGGVRYLRFDLFGTDHDMDPVLAAVGQANDAGLILDLRWNGGGLSNQLQRLAGALLDDSTIIGTFHSTRGVEPLVATRLTRLYQGPLVVLIGPSSGSCAEMLAAAIQDHQRGKLLGRMTNGSVLVSRLFPLPDGGLVLVPISDFRTSTNQRLEGVGVTPDIRVMPGDDDVTGKHDVVLERALEILRSAPSAARTTR